MVNFIFDKVSLDCRKLSERRILNICCLLHSWTHYRHAYGWLGHIYIYTVYIILHKQWTTVLVELWLVCDDYSFQIFLTFSSFLLLFEQSTRNRNGEFHSSVLLLGMCWIMSSHWLNPPPFVFQHQVLQPCSSSSSHPQREWSKAFLFLWQGLICLLLWNIVDKWLPALSDLMKRSFCMSLHRWSTTNQLSPLWSETERLQLLKSKVHTVTSVMYYTLEGRSTVSCYCWTLSHSFPGQTRSNKVLNKVQLFTVTLAFTVYRGPALLIDCV